MSNGIKTVVLPVAGTARSRAPRPGYFSQYSELRPIIDKPIVQFAIEEARSAGITRFIFVTCEEKSQFERQIVDGSNDNSGMVSAAETLGIRSSEAVFVSQPQRLGLGNALQVARELVEGEPFAVIVPNLLMVGNGTGLPEMVAAYEPGGTVIGAVQMTDDLLSNYGVIDLDGAKHDGRIRQVVEKPETAEAPSHTVAYGRWIFDDSVFDALDKLSAGSAGEISLTAAVNDLSASGNVKAVELSGKCFDLRDRRSFVRATVALALENPDIAPAVAEAQYDVIEAGISTPRTLNLVKRYGELVPEALLTQLIRKDFRESLTLVSSFGADSAVLLHMVSRIEPSLPVLFLNTGMLFQETIDYRDTLVAQLGLTGVLDILPDEADLKSVDPDGKLHASAPDRCCHYRKTLPIEKALGPFKAWITGRKRYQSATRSALPVFEEDGAGKIKVNPLAQWGKDDINAYFKAHDLPPHPLVAQRYLSIGCWPCTSPVADGEDERAGRWRGQAKEECGIHIVDGKIVRTGAAEPSDAPAFSK